MATMNFDYIKQMVNIIEDAQSVSFKDKLEIIIRGYRQLDDDEKEMFCNWLAGEEHPVRGLRAKAHIIEDTCNLSQEEINEIVEVWSNVPNY